MKRFVIESLFHIHSLSHRAKLAWAIAAVASWTITAIVAGIMVTQRQVSVAVASQQSVELTGPLTVNLNQEIAEGYEPVIEPNIPGKWEAQHRLLGVARITFTPKDRFQAGESYTLRIRKMKRAITGVPIPDVGQAFRTQPAAGIAAFSLKEGEGNISINPKIKVKLTGANQGRRKLVASLTPAVKLKMTINDDQEFVWTPETPLAQGTGYTFALEDANVTDPAKKGLVKAAFATVSQPVIVAARTGKYFGPGQAVDIQFDQPMHPDDTRFVFDLPGSGVWADNRTYRFSPASLKPNQHHVYKVKAGTRSSVGGVLEADREFSFDTTGAVAASLSPGGGNVALSTPIVVRFDQAVDHASAQSKFSVSPGLGGTFAWSGNTMTYNHAPMSYQTKYTYSVAPGVVPAWGVPNVSPITGSFTTALEVVKLAVPFYKQSYAMSCELTALKMVLQYRGIAATEYEIALKVGYNPRNRDTATNTWDNPDVMYVGFLNGKMNSTGYGVHSGPIAAAAQAYGRPATATRGVSPSWIAQRIREGNPVIFWGHSTPAILDAWNTPQGPVQAYVSAHARVVYGFAGSAENPTTFYLNDPMGAPLVWSASQLSANMNVLGNLSNQVVVVQ